MYIAEARAYNDGIEFYPNNGKVIFAKRCNGKVVVESRTSSYIEKQEDIFKFKILLLLFFAVNVVIFSIIGKLKIPNIEVITVLTVGLIFATLFLVGKAFIPWLILKIVWLVISGYIALKLWVNGKCDFLQKLVVLQPTYEEVEVAVEGMKEYLRLQQSED